MSRLEKDIERVSGSRFGSIGRKETRPIVFLSIRGGSYADDWCFGGTGVPMVFVLDFDNIEDDRDNLPAVPRSVWSRVKASSGPEKETAHRLLLVWREIIR